MACESREIKKCLSQDMDRHFLLMILLLLLLRRVGYGLRDIDYEIAHSLYL